MVYCPECPFNTDTYQLCQLVVEAGRYPSRSIERNVRLTQAISIMQSSGKIWRGGGRVSQEVYSEALLRAYEKFCKECDVYDPSRACVMTWFNKNLQYCIRDVWKEIARDKALFKKLVGEFREFDPPQEDLSEQLSPFISKQISEWIQQESARLRSICLNCRSDIHSQLLIQRHLLDRVSLEDLSKEWQIPLRNLKRFWNNCCLPEVRQFLV